MGLLIAALTFLVVLAVVLGVWIMASTDTSQELIKKRMSAVRKAERRGGEVSLDLKLVRDELMSNVPLLHRIMMQWSWSSKLQEFVVQSGMTIKPAKLLMLSGIIGVAAYIIIGFVYPYFFIQIPVSLAAMTIPLAVVAIKRKRRLKKFEETFPEALDLLGRAVRAGHAFTTGLEMIAKECAEPLAGEFRATFEEQNFGLPLRDALLNLAERVPIVDVRFFVTALLIQKETGGNLAEILDGLARVVRDRFRLHREVQVRTAQGRLTGAILIALPIVVAITLSILNPSYMRVLIEDPKGPTVIAVSALMQVVGTILLWKIIHFEV
jgi:tight adherence protein B